jgi:hypothetical protein
MSNLVELLEEIVLPCFRRVCVARFASRFFVLVGHRDRPHGEWHVEGPFATHEKARGHAQEMQRAAYASEQQGVVL